MEWRTAKGAAMMGLEWALCNPEVRVGVRQNGEEAPGNIGLKSLRQKIPVFFSLGLGFSDCSLMPFCVCGFNGPSKEYGQDCLPPLWACQSAFSLSSL